MSYQVVYWKGLLYHVRNRSHSPVELQQMLSLDLMNLWTSSQYRKNERILDHVQQAICIQWMNESLRKFKHSSTGTETMMCTWFARPHDFALAQSSGECRKETKLWWRLHFQISWVQLQVQSVPHQNGLLCVLVQHNRNVLIPIASTSQATWIDNIMFFINICKNKRHTTHLN